MTRNPITSFWIKRIMLKNKVIKSTRALKQKTEHTTQIHMLKRQSFLSSLVRPSFSFHNFVSFAKRTKKKSSNRSRHDLHLKCDESARSLSKQPQPKAEYYYTFNCLSFHIFDTEHFKTREFISLSLSLLLFVSPPYTGALSKKYIVKSQPWKWNLFHQMPSSFTFFMWILAAVTSSFVEHSVWL